MDDSGARQLFPIARILDDSDSEEHSGVSVGARRSLTNFSGHRGSYELQEDVASRVASRIASNAKVMNSNSDDYFDVELHGAAGELHSTDSLQKEVAKGSVENGFHEGKVDKLSGALAPSSFESQSGSTKPSSTGAGSEKKTEMKQLVPFFKLFKYADRLDILLMFLGTIMAIFDGFTWPAIAFIQSKLLNSFAGLATQSPRHSYDQICKFSLYLVYVSILSLVVSYFEVWCWMYTGERQAGRIRAKYLHAILRQDVGYFDTKGGNTATIVASVSTDTLLIQDAISEKVGNTVQNLALLAGGLVVGFTLCWRVTLSVLPFLPFLLLPGIMYGRALLGLAVRIQIAYGTAGNLAQQAISSVRTVYSFVGEKRTLEAYSNSLESTVSLGKKQGLAKGLAIGLTAQTFFIWAFVCWYGTYNVTHGYASGGEVVFSAFIVLYAGLYVSRTLSSVFI